MAETNNVRLSAERNEALMLGQNYGSITNNFGLTSNQPVTQTPDFTGSYSWSTLRPVASYVERSELSNKLRTQLASPESSEQTVSGLDATEKQHGPKVVVLYGLGGAGKTQLVLKYVQKYRESYTATFWIECASKYTIERDFKQICRLLGGVQCQQNMQDLSIENAVTFVKTWFASRRGKWLFVFDSLDDIDNPDDPLWIDITQYLPDTYVVDSILTSRSSTAGILANENAINVHRLEEEEAVQLLCNTGRLEPKQNANELRKIVMTLDCLPLAVALAGSYISETPGLSENLHLYLESYESKRRDILAEIPLKHIQFYTKSILLTWETSYRALQLHSPKAACLLSLFSFLSPVGIFPALFGDDEIQDPAKRNLASLWKCVVSAGNNLDRFEFNSCVRMLRRYSFLQYYDDGQKSFSMHKLVHNWAYERLSGEERDRYLGAAIALVIAFAGVDIWNPQRTASVLPHLSACVGRLSEAVENIADFDADLYHVHGWLEKSCTFFGLAGRKAERIQAAETDLRIRARRGDLSGPGYIESLHNLAQAFHMAGRQREALLTIDLATKAAAQPLEPRGEYVRLHATRAAILAALGHQDQACHLQTEILNTCLLNGIAPQHYVSLFRSQLAQYLMDTAQFTAAAKHGRKVVDFFEASSGRDDPNTLTALAGLATSLYHLRQNQSALDIYQEVLRWRLKALGAHHESTFSTMISCALCVLALGQPEAAVVQLAEIVETTRTVLGEHHPMSKSAKYHMAKSLSQSGRNVEALATYEYLLEISAKSKENEISDRVLYEAHIMLILNEHKVISDSEIRLQASLDTLQSLFETSNPRELKVIWAKEKVVTVLRSRGDLGAAETLAMKTLDSLHLGKGAFYVNVDYLLEFVSDIDNDRKNTRSTQHEVPDIQQRAPPMEHFNEKEGEQGATYLKSSSSDGQLGDLSQPRTIDTGEAGDKNTEHAAASQRFLEPVAYHNSDSESTLYEMLELNSALLNRRCQSDGVQSSKAFATRENIAQLCRRLGKLDDEIRVRQEFVQLGHVVFDIDHPQRVANAARLLEALDLREETLGVGWNDGQAEPTNTKMLDMRDAEEEGLADKNGPEALDLTFYI